MKLRQYQLDIIQKVDHQLTAGQRKLLIQLETGGGKTVIAGFLTRSIVDKRLNAMGCLCLYLVHRRELIEQVVQTLEEVGLGDMVGVIQSGHAVDKSASLQIASVQTLARRMDSYKKWLNPHLIFVDEAHHIRANTWELILQHYHDSYLIGMTATPARLDGKGLGKHFDCMVQGWTTEKLIENGYLADMECYSIESSFVLNGLKKVAGDYSKKQLKERTGTTKFRSDIIDAFLRHCRDRRVIHYTSSIDDSLKVRDKLREIGVNAAHIDAKTPYQERSSIIKAFGRGDVQVLSNVEIVTEGFDVPDCDAIILSRKTASTVLFRQMIGRARRPKKDGKKAILLDLVGNLLEHDHPDEQPLWDLEDGVVKDKGGASDRKPKVCKACGYMPMVKVADGWECMQCGGKEERKTLEDIKIELIKQKQEMVRRRTQQARNMRLEVRRSLGDPAKLKDIVTRHGVNPYIIVTWEKIYQDYWNKELKKREGLWNSEIRKKEGGNNELTKNEGFWKSLLRKIQGGNL